MLDRCGAPGHPAAPVDFALHARSLGADALHVADLAQLRSAMVAARAASKTQVLVIDTTHERTTGDGGCWWDVAVPEVSSRAEVGAARAAYEAARKERQP
jgi:3D-(3,5/4)-trihydroxycyclohexane-1,2-dione acylhydrolase (decyclizing)